MASRETRKKTKVIRPCLEITIGIHHLDDVCVSLGATSADRHQRVGRHLDEKSPMPLRCAGMLRKI